MMLAMRKRRDALKWRILRTMFAIPRSAASLFLGIPKFKALEEEKDDAKANSPSLYPTVCLSGNAGGSSY